MERVHDKLSQFWDLPIMRRMAPSLTFFFVWTLLPNLAFLAIWLTGGPIRTTTIALYLLVGLSALRFPLPLVAVFYILVLAADLLSLVSGIFNMPISFTLYAVKYISVIRPFASTTYLLFAACVAICSVAVFWFAWRLRPRWRAASLSGACLGVLLMMSVDAAVNLTPEQELGRLFHGAPPFESAMRNSGLAEEDIADTGRDLFVVMVESWGELEDPSLSALVRRPLMRDDIDQRYSIDSGTTNYMGTTTTAEFRELCDRWAKFADFTDQAATWCLPARLNAAGYETIAFHGFSGDMFDRRLWYPNVGFRDIYFRDRLWGQDLRVCKGVFVGVCDVDLARLVEQAVIGANGKPRFVYWLTLNSHLPVDPDIDIKYLDCNGPGDPFAQRQVCYLADQWMQVFDKVASILANETLRPLDVLIVGDHAPPFWTREGRSFFVRGKVPWILLRSRDAGD